nr:hypothetical protein [uncultured Pedobacter sp.]
MATKFTANYFTVLNKNGQNNLYRTDDIDFNELTFSFINRSQAAITFKGGENPSSLEFSMPFLRDGDIDPVKDFKFDNIDGWKPALLLNKKWAVWKFVCKNDIELLPGKSFSFVIKKILCKTINAGYFFIKTIAVPGYADLEPALSKALTIIEPESSKLSLPLGVSYTDLIYPINTQTDRPYAKVSRLKDSQFENAVLPIYLTYDAGSQIKNGFKLLFTTDTDIEIFKPGGEIKEASITIMFLFGSYPHQITTTDLGNYIEMNANQVGWKLRRNADSPSWKWIPDPQTIREFMSFSFNIRRLVTDMEAVEGISLMYVQVNNFGKFADHVFRFQLIKKVADTPMVSLQIVSPTEDLKSIRIGDGPNVKVKLSWNAILANKLEIAYSTRENQRIVFSTHPKEGAQLIELTQSDFELPIRPTAEITTFEATAYGANGSKKTTNLMLNVIQRTAEILSFIATPALTEHGVKTKVILSWDVSDASQLKLLRGEQEIDVTKTTSIEVTVDSPDEYKLVARSYGDVLQNVSKKLKLYTIGAQKSIPLDFYGDAKGDWPKTLIHRNDSENRRGLFVHCGRNHLYQIDGVGFRKVMALETKRGQFALHPEFLYLVVFYNGRKGKYVYGNAQYGDNPSDEQFNGYNNYVTEMKFSPDGGKLFCSFVEGDGTVKDPKTLQQVIAAKTFSKQYRLHYGWYSQPGGIGTPAIAFDEGSATVYFSSYAEKQIYNTKYNELDKINITKAAIAKEKVVAISESKKFNGAGKIFMNSEDDSSILMYDRTFPAGIAPEVLKINGVPTDMLLSADEKTLYLAYIKDNKVVAIDTKDSTKHVSYIVDTPSCLKLSSDGELLFVGNHRSRSLTVIKLNNNNISEPISLGANTGNPMVISIYEDKDRYTAYITKECYAERTNWAAEVIAPNTSHDMSVVTVYKPA